MASIKVMVLVTVEAVVGIRRRGNVRVNCTLVHNKIDHCQQLFNSYVELAINLASGRRKMDGFGRREGTSP